MHTKTETCPCGGAHINVGCVGEDIFSIEAINCSQYFVHKNCSVDFVCDVCHRTFSSADAYMLNAASVMSLLKSLPERIDEYNKSEARQCGMYDVHSNPEGNATIGNFKICKSGPDKVWIQDGESEGGEFPVADFEKVVKEYFDKNF